MINPGNSLEVEVFSLQMHFSPLGSLPSKGVEGELMGPIDGVVSLTF